MNGINKKLVTIAFLFILLAAAATIALSYFGSFQSVTFNPPSGATINLYKDSGGGEESINYDENRPITTIAETSTQKIKKGSYVYTVAPSSKDYKNQTVVVSIDDTTKEITPTLELTDAKLLSIAQSSKPSVQNLLNSKYPNTMRSYSVDQIAAYGAGEWIAVSLKPSAPNLDTMVAILKKSGNQLSLATTPSIVLAQPVYPQIPSEIIGSANRLVQEF